jgi:hypothetical protein
MDEQLIKFLKTRTSQLKELEALAEAVMNVRHVEELGDAYRTLIEQVNEAWKKIDDVDRKMNKAIKRNSKLKKDSRLAWFYSVRSALQKASCHSRPAVNSRNLTKIQDVAYEIRHDLSSCCSDLERQLAKIRKA